MSRVKRHDSRFTIHKPSEICHSAFVICLLILLAGCSGGGQAAVPTFVAPTPGTSSAAAPFLSRPTYVVTAATLTDKISARGDLVAEQQTALLFPTAGTVKAVAVVPGQSVEAGAILAELSAPSQEQNLLQRRSALTIAKLNLQKLEAREASDIDLAIAREQVALAESLTTLAEQQHAATVLTAPFAGTITMFSLQQGSRVSAYETVGTVANLEAVEIRSMLPAEAREQVDVGQSAQIRLDGYGATTFTGTVAELADDAVTWQGAPAFAMVIALDAGQALPATAQIGVDITLLGETHADVPWVPANALITLGDATYLDVLAEAGVERVAVDAGVTDGQRVEIVSGVGAGDTVVLP